MNEPEHRTIDTDPHPIFTTYSAGNFAEVAPERLSPLSWSAVGPPVERGMRRIFQRLWPRARWASGSHFMAVGYFACKPYHNLSTLCYATGHVLGLGPEQVTRSYFQNADVPDVPEGNASWSVQLTTVPRMVREFYRTRRKLRLLDEEITVLESDVSTASVRRSMLSLTRLLPEIRYMVQQAWEIHYSTTLMLVPLTASLNSAGHRLLSYWDELEPLVNRPEELVWDTIGEFADASSPLESVDFLSYCFYEIADDQEPWSRYGRAGAGPPSRSAAEDQEFRRRLWNTVPRARSAFLQNFTELVAVCMAQREHTKSLAMRSLHLLRRLLPVLSELRGIDILESSYLTLDELIDDAQDVGLVQERAADRKEQCDAALLVPMPDTLRTTQHVSTDSEERPARSFRGGQGICPGRVEGRVVFPDTPQDAWVRPCVLVCDAADANISILLPEVDAVVTARGSTLSHIAILLREHGTPSVVGHPIARSVRAGQRVQLNGKSGEVRVVEDD